MLESCAITSTIFCPGSFSTPENLKGNCHPQFCWSVTAPYGPHGSSAFVGTREGFGRWVQEKHSRKCSNHVLEAAPWKLQGHECKRRGPLWSTKLGTVCSCSPPWIHLFVFLKDWNLSCVEKDDYRSQRTRAFKSCGFCFSVALKAKPVKFSVKGTGPKLRASCLGGAWSHRPGEPGLLTRHSPGNAVSKLWAAL